MQIPLGFTILTARSSFVGTCKTVYGFGLIKAKKMSDFFLNHP